MIKPSQKQNMFQLPTKTHLWILGRTSGQADKVSEAHALALLLATIEETLALRKTLV
jgi:hypothetical protein